MKTISLIGGDLRQIYLADLFQKNGFSTYLIHPTPLLSSSSSAQNMIYTSTSETDIRTTIENSDYIIGPTPFSKDLQHIHELGTNPILLDTLLSYLMPEQTLISVAIPQDFKEKLSKKNVHVIDLSKYTEFISKNAIATAEGAIAFAIEHSHFNLAHSNVLILGYGTCGKSIAELAKNFKANVSVTGRKAQTELEAYLANLNYIDISTQHKLNTLDLNQYNFIFNTIPEIVLSDTNLKTVSELCTIVDIASAPGGTDFSYTKDHHINAHLYLGIPGKISPLTSAKIQYEIIKKEIVI